MYDSSAIIVQLSSKKINVRQIAKTSTEASWVPNSNWIFIQNNYDYDYPTNLH